MLKIVKMTKTYGDRTAVDELSLHIASGEIYGFIGIIIWILFFIITFVTAYFIERFKKDNDIQTYKEILAFIDGKQLSYEELQQEKGKRMYQKILYAFFAGVFSLITSLLVIFIMNKI